MKEKRKNKFPFYLFLFCLLFLVFRFKYFFQLLLSKVYPTLIQRREGIIPDIFINAFEHSKVSVFLNLLLNRDCINLAIFKTRVSKSCVKEALITRIIWVIAVSNIIPADRDGRLKDLCELLRDLQKRFAFLWSYGLYLGGGFVSDFNVEFKVLLVL